MSSSAYYQDIRSALTRALCLHNFPSQQVERHNKPEVEVRGSPELLLPPVALARGDAERCLIEQSINSTRVSFKFKGGDPLEDYLRRTYLSLLLHRAEQLDIVRRVAAEGYDVTFLVTAAHLERYERGALVDFIVQFVEDFGAEISEMKLGLKTRARAVVDDFWRQQEQSTQQAQRAAAASGGLGAAA